MRDVNGNEIRLGDRVELFGSDIGVVVFSIDTDEYSSDFPKQDWDYLGGGIMVKTDEMGLVHIDSPDTNEIRRL